MITDSFVRGGILAIGAGYALDVGGASQSCESDESSGELEDHFDCSIGRRAVEDSEDFRCHRIHLYTTCRVLRTGVLSERQSSEIMDGQCICDIPKGETVVEHCPDQSGDA